jgi:5,5'-dehydrodivanillate O-demethylase
MISQEQNERLTQVGAGTPMGNLLRRYWHPLATVPDLDEKPVRRVRIMGENLTLYRSTKGEYGLVGERCAHRQIDMEYGIPEENGLRCPYHGWLYDKTGQCVEMPYDDRVQPEANLKEKVCITGYPVQELGGLIFAYIGPDPVPLLPRWDVLAADGFDRAVQVHVLPCNWLQCMENTADPMHFEYLHAALGNYTLAKQNRPPAMVQRDHVKLDFDRFKYGMMKRRLLEGESEDCDDWTTGHPLLFPNILAQGGIDAPTLQIRVPIDDTHTLHFGYRTQRRKPGAEPRQMEVLHENLYEADGKIIPDTIPKQDMLAWVAQGPICDRTREQLGASDAGVALYRRMLFEGMDQVERGEEPVGVIRDRAENEPMIALDREGKPLAPYESKYQSIFDRIDEAVPVAGE